MKIINHKINYIIDDKIINFKKKSYYLRNKINFSVQIKKKRRQDSFYIWDNIPYSFLILAPSVKNFHQMKNNLYQLNDSILSRKQRFFYKKRYHLKEYTHFYTYRLYMKDFYNFFNILDLILDYEMFIVGFELNDAVYPIEEIVEIFTNLKNDFTFFLKVFNFDFTYIYKEYFNNLNIQCQLLTN